MISDYAQSGDVRRLIAAFDAILVVTMRDKRRGRT